MNEQVNKEIEEWFLDLEDETLEKIKKTYNRSLKDVQAEAKRLQDEIDKLEENADPNDEIRQSQIRSKVYQLDYQQKLEKQISKYMDVMNNSNVKDISDYLNSVYSNGFMTEQYRLMANGLNITMPINQKLLEKAVNTTFDDIPLSTRIYENVNKAKQNIISEISRGLSIGMSNQDMARNLQNTMGVSMRKAFQLAQNEGARVRQSAIKDSMLEAKRKGADIVKQWSATLDGKTRPVHRELDGQYAEIDEKFKYSGGEVNAPKEFGIASEDINCRCTLLSVPRWDITEKHWQRDNETKELVEVKNYADWKTRYVDIVETSNYSGNSARKDISKINYTETKKVDIEVTTILEKVFKGYTPSQLVKGDESMASLERIRTKQNTYKYVLSVVNTSIEAGDSNVDIGNPTLANAIHERIHDVVNRLAIKRANINDLNNVSFLQNRVFEEERFKIIKDVYVYCFTDESIEEIYEIIEKEISARALYDGNEFIAESLVQYLGAEKSSELAKKVYNYFIKEWKK